MNSYKNYLKEVCQDLTKKLGLDKKDQHVEIIYKDDKWDQIAYWTIVGTDKVIVKRYEGIQDLTKAYMEDMNKNDYGSFINQKDQWSKKAFHYLVDKIVDGDPTVELVNVEFRQDELVLCYEDEYKRMHLATVTIDDFMDYISSSN